MTSEKNKHGENKEVAQSATDPTDLPEFETSYPKEKLNIYLTQLETFRSEFETDNIPYKNKIRKTFTGDAGTTRREYLNLMNKIKKVIFIIQKRSSDAVLDEEVTLIESSMTTLKNSKELVHQILDNPNIKLGPNITDKIALDKYKFDEKARERISLRREFKSQKIEYKDTLRRAVANPEDTTLQDELKKCEKDFLEMRKAYGQAMQEAIARHAKNKSERLTEEPETSATIEEEPETSATIEEETLTEETEAEKSSALKDKLKEERKRDTPEKIQSQADHFQARMFNGLVVSVAEINNELKREELSENKQRLAGILKEKLEQHRTKIKYVSRGLLVGSILAGSVFYFARKAVSFGLENTIMTSATAGKTASMLTSVGIGMAGGAALGRVFGAGYTKMRLNQSETAIKKAQKTFSIDSMEALEKEISGKMSKVANAERLESLSTIAGGAMGGVAGFIFAPEDADVATEELGALCEALENISDDNQIIPPEDLDILPEPLPEVIDTYSVEAGDNLWDMSEGQTNAPQPEAFQNMSGQQLQSAIAEVINQLKANPEAAQEIGMRVIDNPEQWLYSGDNFNPEKYNEFVNQIAEEKGWNIDPAEVATEPPEEPPVPTTVEAPKEAITQTNLNTAEVFDQHNLTEHQKVDVGNEFNERVSAEMSPTEQTELLNTIAQRESFVSSIESVLGTGSEADLDLLLDKQVSSLTEVIAGNTLSSSLSTYNISTPEHYTEFITQLYNNGQLTGDGTLKNVIERGLNSGIISIVENSAQGTLEVSIGEEAMFVERSTVIFSSNK